MVGIHLEVALAFNFEPQVTMSSELVEHVVEKRNPGRSRDPVTVEVNGYPH